MGDRSALLNRLKAFSGEQAFSVVIFSLKINGASIDRRSEQKVNADLRTQQELTVDTQTQDLTASTQTSTPKDAAALWRETIEALEHYQAECEELDRADEVAPGPRLVDLPCTSSTEQRGR